MNRLGLVSAHFGGVNGAGQSAVDVLVALLATGNRVGVISEDRCDLPENTLAGLVEEPEWFTPPARLRLPRTRKHLPRRAASWAKNGVLDLWRGARIRRFAPDVVFVNTLGSDAIWQRTRGPLRTREALIVRESPRTFEQASSRIGLREAAQRMARYDPLIFVTARGRAEWLAMPELAGKCAFYIPNCCREDEVSRVRRLERSALRAALGLPRDRFLVVCVGTLQPRKGQDLLVNELPRLFDTLPELSLAFVGPLDTPWASDLARRVTAEGYAGHVLFAGRRLNALEYIHAADALILPSRAEAMPRAILEAMALERPVVATGVDGIPELVDHAVTGYLFPVADPSSMTEYLALLYHDTQRRESMGREGGKKYWREFARSHQIERYRAAVQAILGDDRPSCGGPP